jgi:FAD/FMN-containing dehydrogenase
VLPAAGGHDSAEGVQLTLNYFSDAVDPKKAMHQPAGTPHDGIMKPAVKLMEHCAAEHASALQQHGQPAASAD